MSTINKNKKRERYTHSIPQLYNNISQEPSVDSCIKIQDFMSNNKYQQLLFSFIFFDTIF